MKGLHPTLHKTRSERRGTQTWNPDVERRCIWVIPPSPCSFHLTASFDCVRRFRWPFATLLWTSSPERTKSNPYIGLWALPPYSGKAEAVLSITPPLLHQHQIGLQPVWHGAASQGDWTRTQYTAAQSADDSLSLMSSDEMWQTANGRKSTLQLDDVSLQRVTGGARIYCLQRVLAAAQALPGTSQSHIKNPAGSPPSHYNSAQRRRWEERGQAVVESSKLTILEEDQCWSGTLLTNTVAQCENKGGRERERDRDDKRDTESSSSTLPYQTG